MYTTEERKWIKIGDTIIALHEIQLVTRQRDMRNTAVLFKGADSMYSVGDIDPDDIFKALGRPTASTETTHE